jgi:hypothetical protein
MDGFDLAPLTGATHTWVCGMLALAGVPRNHDGANFEVTSMVVNLDEGIEVVADGRRYRLHVVAMEQR